MTNELKTTRKCRMVVLISGSGSNLQALLDASIADDYPAHIVAVISNRPNVKGLERAAAANIPALVLDHTHFSERASFDAELQKIIDGFEPDLLVLAGFMRILTPELVEHYLGRMLNIHPSLLPKYPGLHTHKRALAAGDAHHGVTVHFVTPELDGGPAVIQAQVDVLPTDTEMSLAQRVLQQEHLIYPMAVRWFAEQRLMLDGSRARLDGDLLPSHGHLICVRDRA
jgi:phosphoribosylglycinamide formyltransferase 1